MQILGYLLFIKQYGFNLFGYKNHLHFNAFMKFLKLIGKVMDVAGDSWQDYECWV